jgi:hypothetical protein
MPRIPAASQIGAPPRRISQIAAVWRKPWGVTLPGPAWSEADVGMPREDTPLVANGGTAM